MVSLNIILCSDFLNIKYKNIFLKIRFKKQKLLVEVFVGKLGATSTG